ncbi:MAG TPA: Ku protein [Chitinophagaceae bacterium]|nr:Ku protein [Chitinophagaceae bacterium]
MQAVWSGSIGFGLVNIPVKMYAATEESNIPFVTLDKSNHARINYKKVNQTTGEEVKHTDIIKGFKVGDDYVIMDEEDFKKASPEKLDHLEILQFIFEKEIDARYFEKPYYLQPDKTGAKPYALLRDTLQKEGKAALGPLVYHKKEWICLIKPLNDHLVLHRLRFAQEIRSTDSITVPKIDIKTEELKMATMLVSQLTKPFQPELFKDEFSEKLMKVINDKSKGKATTVKHMKVVSNKTVDLMEVLKASLKTPTKKAS